MLKKIIPFIIFLLSAAPAILMAEEKSQEKDGRLALSLVMGDPEGSEMGFLGEAFKNYVSQESKGMIDVRLSYGGGLDADEAFQFHRAQTGRLDMAFGGVGNLAPMADELGILTLPYLFPDEAAVIRGTTGKPAELLNSWAEKAGLRILAWAYCGWRFISNSKRPVKSMEDLRGLRVRTPQSIAMIKTYRAFGAVPMPLAWPMTFGNLQNDLVDGQCYDYHGFRAMRFQDAGQKHITEIHYLYNLQPLVINNRLFLSLPEKDQRVLMEAGRRVQSLSYDFQKEMNEEAKAALVAEGVRIIQAGDESEWRKAAMSKVWPQVIERVGGARALNMYLKESGLPPWNEGG